MSNYLRLRQICLVAPSLQGAVDDVAAVLGTPVCYRDPNVAKYGLENALFALGPDILEVVAPTREGTAAGRFLERSGGKGGYMVILDCDDVAARRQHAEAMGVRVAATIEHHDYSAVQLHPRDCRAAMLEFNHTTDGEALTGPYHPAGPDWPSVVRPDSLPRLVAVELEGPDPAGLAAHWGRVLQALVTGGDPPCIRLGHGTVLFRKANEGEAERLIGLQVRVRDVAAALEAATSRGLRGTEDGVWLSGIRLTVLPA
jgi:Glyoxalase-like domain